MMNATPADAFAPANVDPAQPAPAVSGAPFAVGTISAAPAAPAGFTGLDYAFDYGNARFVLLDQFTPTTGTTHASLDASQIDWMKAQLAGRESGTHAFVFGHKGIITENHVDTLFTDDKNAGPAGGPTLSNAFIQGLQDSGVRYYMGGHDHMHNRALVKSVDGKSQVDDITLASDSSKFYIPYGTAGYDKRTYDPATKKITAAGTVATADPTQTNDYLFNVTVAGGTTRETEISQDLFKVGYYVFKVDGPRVTVEYWAADANASLVAAEGEYQISTTPELAFKKIETFGYSLNGKEFQVPEGKPYTSVVDSFDGTSAAIIAGANTSTTTDTSGRPLTKTVDTGWSKDGKCDGLSSSVLNLWGMTDLGATSTDTYVLSMRYGPRPGRGEHGGPGTLVTRDERGRWVNAVAVNDGGKAKFVLGPYKSGYGLGTYGVDVKSRTAWAVVDHEGSFAVSDHIDR
jgi:hypothetical protein